MAETPRSAGTSDDEGMRYDREPTPGLPRWSKVAGIALIILILLIVAVMLFGGRGGHTPPRHGGTGSAPPAGITQGHMPPAGGHGS
jgi:hypothetical protein